MKPSEDTRPELVVVIFRERNDVNLCAFPFSSYPTGKVPEIGDKLPLYAEKTFNIRVGDKPAEATTIRYLNELATVIEVWTGKGNLLHPGSENPFYSIPEDLKGYGIRVAWEGEPIPKGVKPIEAEVMFGF